MTIAFVHEDRAFLPEVDAYREFFAARGIGSKVIRGEAVPTTEADVFWYFMGLYRKRPPQGLVIHEYSSASVPPRRAFKDLAKRLWNGKPDFRLFQNAYVKKRLGFSDGIPQGYREMGVSDAFFGAGRSGEKKYDFIYTGTLAGRHPEKMLDGFAGGEMRDATLLVLSRDYAAWQTRYASAGNIRWVGPVSHDEVPGYLAGARYAIHSVPDEEPFNCQASTRFLEYMAAGLPVITNNYYWLSEFQDRYGGKCFVLKDDWSNFTPVKIAGATFEPSAIGDWRWEKQIVASGVVDFLRVNLQRPARR